MAADNSSSSSNSSNAKLLEELEALSQTLYKSHTQSVNRRTASLALPRTSLPPITGPGDDGDGDNKLSLNAGAKPRARRMSLSPWRSRPKLDDEESYQSDQPKLLPSLRGLKKLDDHKAAQSSPSGKKGLWNWKPIRALSHIGMHKLSCLLSVEVVGAQGLPASMNGLRLSVCVRKRETKDGAVHTMPARVSQGAADFEETLFVRCHVYCSNGAQQAKKQLKFEPRPFLIYLFALDAKELDFGASAVDLSHLIQESIEKNAQGTRVRQWDAAFNLSGKAKGGELVFKLGFQIMEKDGSALDIYGQAQGLQRSPASSAPFSAASARRQSKSSFSIASPRMKSRAWSPNTKEGGGGTAAAADVGGIEELNLDEPAAAAPAQKSEKEEAEASVEDLDLPEFEVVDKGVEFQDEDEEEEVVRGGKDADERSAEEELVKAVVHDQVHLTRLTELDSIAQQIKALESMMRDEKALNKNLDGEVGSQRLDADEETVTREFLQMLEDEQDSKFKFNQLNLLGPSGESGEKHSAAAEAETKAFLSDLGKGLGCVVQTRHGGFLAAMNPLNIEVERKDVPKLAMQISKPVVLPLQKSVGGFELFQMMAAAGPEELSKRILSIMPMDDLMGKTAEQVAFEGIASAIIHGRNKEGASSSAARTIAAVKTMGTAMSTDRRDRITTGIWNVSQDPVAADEILAFSLQKLEAAAVEALKIQADMAEEEAPFDVSSFYARTVTAGKQNDPLASGISVEEWMNDNPSLLRPDNKSSSQEVCITLSAVVQLRDPLRRYEAVGGPMIVLIQATDSDVKPKAGDEEKRFKVASLHVGGIKMRTGDRRSVWGTDKQRLTAMQWLVAYGLGKAGRKDKQTKSKGQDLFWSISMRMVADMWLKPIRNPDVKF